MDSSDITSLLGSSSGGGSPFNLDSIIQSLMPFMIILTVLSVLLTLLYGWSVFQRWRVNHAIIEIRDILRDMQTAHTPKATEPVQVEETSPPESSQTPN